jgi:hypothetical protein
MRPLPPTGLPGIIVIIAITVAVLITPIGNLKIRKNKR